VHLLDEALGPGTGVQVWLDQFLQDRVLLKSTATSSGGTVVLVAAGVVVEALVAAVVAGVAAGALLREDRPVSTTGILQRNHFVQTVWTPFAPQGL
jgi:hypothetical protein